MPGNLPDSLQRIASEVSRCKKCPLFRRAIKAVPGEGPPSVKIFFVGQAPGKEEDRTGRPFVGRAGKFLDELLQRAGLNRKRVFITSVVKHFPPKNRPPRSKEVKACKPYLIRQLKVVNPKIVVLMGNVARKALENEPVLFGRIVIKTAHPAAGMRFPKIKVQMQRAFDRLRVLKTQTI